VNRLDDGTINAIAGPERLVLRTPAALYGEDLRTLGEFTVEAGESVPFILAYGTSVQPPPPPIDAFEALQRTEASWRKWSDRCPDVGPWSQAVKRSLITLKALTYAPTGGIVAAVTTSLPERLGGVRNWDYRYCWLRDATFTLLAFMHLGYYEEARDWRDWLVRAVAGSPEQVQIVYSVGGERWLPELIVPWLPGYEKSSPVRIGNAAYQQLQIDVFGEIADAMLQNLKAGMGISERARALRSYWNTWPARGGSRTKAFGKCAADLSTSSIQRSWPGLHSIAPPTRWRRKCTKIQFSDGETLLEKFMRTFVSVDLTQSLTVSCSPMAPSGSMPACC